MLKLISLLFVFVALVAAQAPPPPPFLQGAPAAVISQFHQLMQASGGKPEEQLHTEVRAFVARQSPQIRSSFASFEAQMIQQKSQSLTAHKNVVAKFSPGAKALDAQIRSIVENPRIPMQSKGEQIEKLINAAPAGVKGTYGDYFEVGLRL